MNIIKPLVVLSFLLLSISPISAQDISATELLDKAINYHDPDQRWDKFSNTLYVTMKTPNNADRRSKIIINLPQDFFKVTATRDTVTTEYVIDRGTCSMTLNGSSIISKAQKKAHNMSCERANLYKNYYTYLYGLPMKLKDNGTIIHDQIQRQEFKGKTYLTLKVSYEESVGSDIWFFYFNPETYAMEAYQFFKTDDRGDLIIESGEYILLSEFSVINGIKIPKHRAWYFNNDDGYLGTDVLTN